MLEAGIKKITKDEADEHFALIDDELVWHGGVVTWRNKRRRLNG